MLPLSLTSLSQRIDEVRVIEIADYSTYYQPVVMRDIYGFGQPLDHRAMLWEPGILGTAWGSVVRQLAAGLGITLDEPLEEVVDRRPAERDLETASVHIPAGTMAAVRFQVVGKVDGVPRVVLDHVTRTAEDQVPEWPTPPEGGGCYRVVITGEPVAAVRPRPPRRARRPQRLRDDRHRPAAGERGPRRRRRPRRSGHRAGPAAGDGEGAGGVMSILDRFAVTDQVAVVTGAGRGIGAATAVALAEAGADVVISSRTAAQLEEVAERVRAVGRRALVVPADLSDADAVVGLARAAYDELGRLDTVVNNVGGTIPNAFLDTDVAYLEEAFHFNVSTAHALSRAAVPLMLKGIADGQDGAQKSIVTISSMMGRASGRGYLAYGTAKAALAHWSRLAAADLAPRIRVNGIFVGSVMTSALEFVAGVPEMRQQLESKTPLGRVGEAEDVAAAVLYLSSRAGQYVTGKMLEVDGGIQAPNLDLGLPDL